MGWSGAVTAPAVMNPNVNYTNPALNGANLPHMLALLNGGGNSNSSQMSDPTHQMPQTSGGSLPLFWTGMQN